MPRINRPEQPKPKPLTPPASAVVVSYSELDTYRQCPLKWFLAYDQRWTRSPEFGGPLHKGTMWHKLLDAHYRVLLQTQDTRTPDEERLATAREAAYDALVDGKRHRTLDEVQDLVWWMYEGYVEKWGADPEWRILAVEHQVFAPLRTPTGRRSNIWIKGRLDLLVRDNETGALLVVDHKSGQNLPTQMDLSIDDQFGLYTWLMREQGYKVAGAVHSASRTQRNKSFMPLDTRFSRTLLTRTDHELNNLAADAFAAAYNAHAPASKALPLYSSPDPRQCGWKCDFKEVHLAVRTGRSMPEALTEWGFVQDFTRH